MNKNNIIFVGGIHGVGKTTLCKYLSDELDICHYSSSDLISKLNSERVRNDKTVDDVEGNQNVLLEAMKLFLNQDVDYILDGHFCLLQKDHKFEKVPLKTFQNLNIKTIVVLIDDYKEIIKRIELRDGKKYSKEFISEFQRAEVENAKYICSELNLECKIVKLNEKKELVEFMKNDNAKNDN